MRNMLNLVALVVYFVFYHTKISNKVKFTKNKQTNKNKKTKTNQNRYNIETVFTFFFFFGYFHVFENFDILQNNSDFWVVKKPTYLGFFDQDTCKISF